MNSFKPASHLKSLIELFDREWHRFSFPAFGFWRDRGWNGAGSGFELNYYTRGTNTVVQDKRTLRFKHGDLIYVPDDVRSSFCEEGSFDLYYVMFRFDAPDLNARMAELFRLLDFEAAPLAMPGLQAEFRAFMTELRMDRHVSVLAKNYFLHIFVKIYMELAEHAGHRNKHELIVRQVIEDLQERMDIGGKILLPDVAARHGLNERYLNQLFKAVTGTTIGQYVLAARIESAKRLLETTTMPITEIAIVSGFYDGAHFSKAFRASVSRTPQEYRGQHGYA
ncbi:helix-turn-helix domain-containing protein [Paenibacillus sp. MWE-103]|uniref:Helix-turn-helix domain-containing protein n=1 Tax=Paenibacillus artemisiicola TaxID=1172618 RepID=A0ABS3W379_9BACL|nr:helix-turn-helix domain-containing protein [Paenibacillus artemisiicola]MBO7742761.1 helix-turn-helix domain-containing protein [Paenibacillus artemisiicola]